MKKVLIINGHPNKDSFCSALVKSYAKGCLRSGNEVIILNLNELKFDLNLNSGFKSEQELETDLKLAQQHIHWAQHIVVVHPVWWGSVPALLKGFFDRTLLPGFAFKYKKDSPMWDKLLVGKTGHLIYTTDTPLFIYNWFFGAPSVNIVKKRVLQFCGIDPVKVTGIGPIRNSTEPFRTNWLTKLEAQGAAVK
jgi:putative NADPH-quinone reductase